MTPLLAATRIVISRFSVLLMLMIGMLLFCSYLFLRRKCKKKLLAINCASFGHEYDCPNAQLPDFLCMMFSSFSCCMLKGCVHRLGFVVVPRHDHYYCVAPHSVVNCDHDIAL